MKPRILAAVLLFSCCSFAGAGPYFKLLDVAHPQINAGVWVDPTGGKPAFGSAVALVTHSIRDGSLLEMFQADWSPLTIGGGYGDGEGFLALGPSANLSPAVKKLALQALDFVAAGKYPNLRELLAPKPDGTGADINIAFGPAFLWRPVENGTCLSLDRWQGHITIFAGAAWHF